MKVVLFANIEWYLYNFRRSLAAALRDAGHEVLLVSPPGPYGERLGALGYRWLPAPMQRRSLNPFRELALVWWLRRMFQRERVDLVHGFTIKSAVYGALAARLSGVPARVSSVAGMGYVFISDAPKARILRPLVRGLLRVTLGGRGARLILQNPDDVALFRRERLVRSEATRLIPSSGVDCERFSPGSPTVPSGQATDVDFIQGARLASAPGFGVDAVSREGVARAQATDVDRTQGPRTPPAPGFEVDAVSGEGVARAQATDVDRTQGPRTPPAPGFEVDAVSGEGVASAQAADLDRTQGARTPVPDSGMGVGLDGASGAGLVLGPGAEREDARFRVLLPARLLWDKGLAEYVEASRLLQAEGRAVDFLLAGDPDPGNPASVPEATVRGWAESGLVQWLGHVDDMPALFRSVDAVVLPSYREGLPKGLIEAAACGLPLVATDVPGCREVVSDGVEGMLVPVRDARALADAIARLQDAPELRARLGRNARARALAEYDERIVIRRTLAVYEELLPGVLETPGG